MTSFAYRILTPPAEPWEAIDSGEVMVLMRYLEHLQRLRQNGSVRLVGRGQSGEHAFMLVDAEDEARAKILARNDPAVSEGLMRIARRPSMVVLNSVKADQDARA